MRNAQKTPQTFFCKGIDKLIFTGSSKDNAEYSHEFIFIRRHLFNSHHWELDRPYPAHLRNPVICFFQRCFLAEVLCVLTITQTLTIFDHAFSRRIMNRIYRLLHMFQPILLRQSIDIPSFCHDTTVLVTTASCLAHIQCHFVFCSVGRSQIEVCSEHTGGHIAQFAAHNIPGTGIQLFFHSISGKLYYSTGHIFPFIAGVTGNATKPAGFFTKLRDVKCFIESSINIVFLFIGASCNCHIHHIGNIADGCGAFFPVRFKNAHDLKKIGSHSGNLAIQLSIGFFLRN